jgi:cytochrome-b5 reductase
MYSTVGIGAIGLAAWYWNRSKTPVERAVELTGKGPDIKEAPKVFKGGEQGFVPLTLEKVEDINHNTKRFRFKFEDQDAVSGLHIASALITKFQKEGDEKPTIKPYTPTSDEGEPTHV